MHVGAALPPLKIVICMAGVHVEQIADCTHRIDFGKPTVAQNPDLEPVQSKFKVSRRKPCFLVASV